MRIKQRANLLGLCSVAIFLLASIVSSSAESYSKLQSDGYKTSKLTHGASGSLGWIVSNGEKKFFCRMRAAHAYVGKSGMVGFTSSGRQIGLNRKVYENMPADLINPPHNFPT